MAKNDCGWMDLVTKDYLSDLFPIVFEVDLQVDP
jgi:hypothetical protein